MNLLYPVGKEVVAEVRAAAPQVADRLRRVLCRVVFA
jgi:hypothetical protein